MRKIIKYLLIPTLVALTSCKAKKAIVDKQPPRQVQVKKFPLSDYKNNGFINLTENLVFLWKQETEMTDTQVRDVQLLSKEKDNLESKQRELKHELNLLEKSYYNEVEKLDNEQKEEWLNLPDKIETKKVNIENLKKSYLDKGLELEKENEKLYDLKASLEKANQELLLEQEKPNRDESKILELTDLINNLKESQTKIENNISKINSKINKTNENISKAQNELNQMENLKQNNYKDVGLAYDAKKAEEIRIAPELKSLSDQITEIVKKITENVDLLPTPSATLEINENNIKIILLWKIHEYCIECETEFSTDKNNIQQVKYDENGGVLEFKLMDQMDIYSFHLIRTNYEDKTGKIFFSGDLTINYSNDQVRFGSLKFQEKLTE